MRKKITDSQHKGKVAEDAFKYWASSVMQWYCTKPELDMGIDFVCQIRGEKIDQVTSVMSDSWLLISVRSSNNYFIRINRSDANLILNSKIPTALALVKLETSVSEPKIAIKIPDQGFIRELVCFLQGNRKTRRIRFADAIEDAQAIQRAVEEICSQSYSPRIARLRTEIQLGSLIQDPYVEVIHTPYGNWIHVSSENLIDQPAILPRFDKDRYLLGQDVKMIYGQKPLIPSGPINATGTTSGLTYIFTEEKKAPQVSELWIDNNGKEDLQKQMTLIQAELSKWNYDIAFTFASE